LPLKFYIRRLMAVAQMNASLPSAVNLIGVGLLNWKLRDSFAALRCATADAASSPRADGSRECERDNMRRNCTG
jgi:hypothetical protein